MVIAVSLLLLYFLINYSLTSTAVFGGDSGNIVLSYFYGSIAHPPGYPLNSLLGFILTRILPGETFAFRANLVSALYLSLTLPIFYLTLRNLSKNSYTSLSAALVLAFASLFWLYAHVAEVFQLSILLVTISLFYTFGWYLSKKDNFRSLLLGVFFLGLAVFHHQTNFLLVPAYLLLLFRSRKSLSKIRFVYAKLTTVFLLGLLPYLYAILSGILALPTNWGNPASFSGFLRIISRADYGTFTAAPELVGFGGLARLSQLIWYIKSVLLDFTFVGLVLSVIGFIWLYFRKRDLFWFFLIGFLATGPFFVAYASFPPVETFLQGVSERFFLTSYLFLALTVGFGLVLAFKILTSFFLQFYKNRVVVTAVVGFGLLFLPFVMGIINYPKADLSAFTIGRTLSEDILNSADNDGIIFMQGDTATFNTQYSHFVEGVRDDLKLVMTGRLRHSYYREKLIADYPDLVYPQGFNLGQNVDFGTAVTDFVAVNFDGRPIYSMEKLPVPSEYLWVQEGMLLRLYRRSQEPAAGEIAAKIEQNLSKIEFKVEDPNRYLNFFEDHIRIIYARIFARNGSELLRRDLGDKAEKYFRLASEISPDDKQILYGLGVSYFQQKKCGEAVSTFEKLMEVDSEYWPAWEGFGRIYSECMMDSQAADYYLKRAAELREKQQAEPIER